jgi:hypothetical protein
MLRRARRRDRLLGLVALGALLLDPPVLNLVGGTVFGWPSLYLYLFGVWGLLIAGAAWLGGRGTAPPGDGGRKAGR